MHFGFHSLLKERVGRGRERVVLREGEDGGGERLGGEDGGGGRGWSLTLFSHDPGFTKPLHVQGPISQYPCHNISSPASVLETNFCSLHNQAFPTHFVFLKKIFPYNSLPILLESIILAIYHWVGQKLFFSP